MAAELSPILDALYHGRGADAEQLAAARGREHLSVHEAAALGATDRLARLLDDDPTQANAWSSDGFQPLGLACFFGRRAAAELLLARGGEVSTPARNAFQVGAIHAALAGPEPELARTLIEAGADVNARQQGGVTPLHEAALIGSPGLVELLLAHGADPLARDDQGRTPADMARERGQASVLELLAARSG